MITKQTKWGLMAQFESGELIGPMSDKQLEAALKIRAAVQSVPPTRHHHHRRRRFVAGKTLRAQADHARRQIMWEAL